MTTMPPHPEHPEHPGTSAPPARRTILSALTATVALLAAGQLPPAVSGAVAAETGATGWTVQTMEAFADTLIPGERRSSGDRAIAGAVTGPGAVQAGVIQTLTSPELPLAPLLPEIAALLNARALAYATLHLILLPPTLPSFVGLPFRHRTTLLGTLFDPGEPDRAIWQVLSLLTGLAFDSAAHLDTRQALDAHHPGLDWLDFPPPGADGLWRFPHYSYGKALATPHPATTPSGSPA
ncbi:DUF5987 family protein [Streptomyces sp. NEAU-Y11]|uniref:DUF5987 family protein n=1 Tax=Streptomyces cucumeris TaxID=2962890 RepID=UPI0020C84BCA|nr:DUF5987 family protein [Streptomyces sp. NEAU-Y11]MCP9211363.1 DUF5987 family protein [Streptomyces sp. NEAU-Y11]